MEDKITTPPATDPTAPDEPIVVEQKSNGRLSIIDPRTNIKGFLLFILAAVVVLSGVTFAATNINDDKKIAPPVAKKDNFKPIAPYSIVYGFWTGNEKSSINVVDLNSGEIFGMAELPYNIKKVTVTSPKSLIFINNTDILDHGKAISEYSVDTKKVTTLVNSDTGFGIDDYVVSPNQKYIALWEVSVPQDSDLSAGSSRVYTVNLDNPSVKNLIYDEVLPQTKTAHYPVAIEDNGQVFMDTFMPNSGVGWAHGMSYAPFSGPPTPIKSMQDGTYGTQPQASSDGRYLAFAGYNGKLGLGINNYDGFRQAVVSPNTVEVLDTGTMERKVLIDSSGDNIYPQVMWDKNSGNIIYTSIAKDPDKNGQYIYKFASSATQIIIGENNVSQKNNYSILTSLNSSNYFSGAQDVSSSTLGNLGKTYSQLLSKVAVYDNPSKKFIPLNLNSVFVQYISIYPNSYFKNLPILGHASIGEEDTNQLQLKSFAIKPQLKPVRETQQSNPPTIEEKKDLPKCADVAAAQCNSLNQTNYTGSQAKSGTGDTGFDDCFDSHFRIGITETCSDSPLYLYGTRGQSVNVSVNTRITNSSAPYNNSYKGVLTGDGGITIGNNNYESLEYEYVPAIKKLLPPTYGEIVKVNDFGKTVNYFGDKLGLSKKETASIVNKVEEKLNSKYVFVSFYDEKTSKAILPITFEPTPDIYRNIVFYFKQTDRPNVVSEPKFEQYPSRTGFTAVEVSYILE